MSKKTLTESDLVTLEKDFSEVSSIISELNGLVSRGARSEKVCDCMNRLTREVVLFVPKIIEVNVSLKGDEGDDVKIKLMNNLFGLFWVLVLSTTIDKDEVQKLGEDISDKMPGLSS